VKPYVQWVAEDGFVLRKNWDKETGWFVGGNLKLFDHQERILGHALSPDSEGILPYTEVIYSCPKKSGKTTIGASIAAWYSEEGDPYSEIYFLANSQEHAQSRGYIMMHSHMVERGLVPLKDKCNYPNGTTVEAVSTQYSSLAGGDPALTVWDELWAYETERHRRLWAEMTIPPTQKNPLKVIVTYAGYKADAELLWKIYEDVVVNGEPVPELADIVDSKGRPVCYRSGRRFAYWDHEPRMPWQTEDYYALEAKTQRHGDFIRLHRNEWATAEDPFIPIEWWDASIARGEQVGLVSPLIYAPDHPYRQYPVTMAVDAGVKHDCTAIVGVYYDIARGRIGMACHQIWIPDNKEEMFDLDATVGAYLLTARTKLNIRKVVYDPRFLHQTMLQLRNKGMRVEEFKQTEAMLTSASMALHDALQHGTFETYPAPDLRSHLEYAQAKTTSKGFRIVKEKNAKYKIDGAVALSMATFAVLDKGGTNPGRKLTLKDSYKHRRSRQSIVDQSLFPPELRT